MENWSEDELKGITVTLTKSIAANNQEESVTVCKGEVATSASVGLVLIGLPPEAQ
jgi:hypothetical protein